MHTYLLTPHAPLLLRKGKSTRGERADDSFNFPLPSTVAGMLRTAWVDAQSDKRTFKQAEEVGWFGGHLLAKITGDKPEPLFPKPADAYYAALEDEDGNVQIDEKGKPVKKLYRLVLDDLTKRFPGADCDLPNQLQPVFLPKNTPASKPADGATWWTLNNLTQWLLGKTPTEPVDQLGTKHLPTDTRTHVKIDTQSRSGESGHLFRSTGVDFMNSHNNLDEIQGDLSQRGWEKTHYALLARFKQNIDNGLVRLGSGGRLSSLRKCEDSHQAWPTTQNLKNLIDIEDLSGLENLKKFRLVLVSPALFEDNGWFPDWLDKETFIGNLCSTQVKLCAAALERWQPLAGWDMAKKKYKPTQRMVPAGSVYWFEIQDETALDWEKLWLKSICTRAKDGFGLVVPGVWET